MMRAAIYFTPPADAPLTRAAAQWLGRDPFTGALAREPDIGIDPLVGEPARYGFHATIKAPFGLAPGRGLGELADELAAFCARQKPVQGLKLEVTMMPGGFLALAPERASPELAALAAMTVRHFEPFRAPATPAETARRAAAGLTESQRGNLARYGYPHVMDDFRFHMTLTARLGRESAPTLTHLRRRFQPLLQDALAIDALALFIEPFPGAPFTIVARCPLLARATLPETIA